MPGLACCAACSGFIVDPSAACVHCGAPPPPRRTLARYLLVRVLGVATSVTLMACYGATYDCPNDRCGLCYDDSQCSAGEYCDEDSGACEWGGYCYDDSYCPSGFECDLIRQTCVPEEPDPGYCTSHDDCAVPEQQCDFTTGECVPAIACGFDGATCGEYSRCDPWYGICVGCVPTWGSCGQCTGEITCAATPPACPDGTHPGIENGCYTAACIADATCGELECANLDELACLERPACIPIYQGLNCTNPDGDPCTTDPVCTCESYVFDSCEPVAPSPP